MQWHSQDCNKIDPGLTEHGVLQAKLFGQGIKNKLFMPKIFSSPFVRCVQTADQVA